MNDHKKIVSDANKQFRKNHKEILKDLQQSFPPISRFEMLVNDEKGKMNISAEINLGSSLISFLALFRQLIEMISKALTRGKGYWNRGKLGRLIKNAEMGSYLIWFIFSGLENF